MHANCCLLKHEKVAVITNQIVVILEANDTLYHAITSINIMCSSNLQVYLVEIYT